MHRGLLIPEVVELICGVAEFSTLAALARTSHSFQPPALAVLWETQTSLFQLLKCLPSDLVEVVPPPQGQDIATTLVAHLPPRIFLPLICSLVTEIPTSNYARRFDENVVLRGAGEEFH
jgi:hypothetical protein